VGDEAQRQRGLIQDFVAVHVGHADLGGGQHVQVGLRVEVDDIPELGELSRPDHALLFDHEGRVQLRPPMGEVIVEHPVGQSALQAGARPGQDVEARPGLLDAALEIDDAQRRAKVPVGLRLKVEFRQRAVRGMRDVVRVAHANRHGLMGQVGQPQHHVVQLGVDGAHLLIQPGGAAAQAAQRLL